MSDRAITFRHDAYGMINEKRRIFSETNEAQIRSGLKSASLEEVEVDDGFPMHHADEILSNKDSNRSLQQRLPNPLCSIVIHNPNFEQGPAYFFRSPNFTRTGEVEDKGLSRAWSIGGLRIITLVARFILQLKTNTNTWRIRLLTFQIFQLIEDSASDFKRFKLSQAFRTQQHIMIKRSFQQIHKAFKRVRRACNFFCDQIKVIQPESTLKIAWDSIVLLFIVINIFYIPMSLSFDLNKLDQSLTLLLFETIPSYIFILEILVNFNTAFYSQGMIHTKRTEIFKHYLTGAFFADLLIAIPFILAQFQIPYIQFVLLLRVTRVRSMIQNVEDLLNVKESVQAILELSKLIYFIVFVVHMCSCGWHLLGRIEIEDYGDKNSWLIVYDHYNSPWIDRYIVSMYWSIITTLTVGYGDIVPQTSIERIYVMLVSLIICGVFGYTISTIGQILETLGHEEKQFKKQMKEINAYIKDRQLNFQLSLKVRKYFEYQLQIQQRQNQSDEKFVSTLSEQLRSEVMVDMYKGMLQKSWFLKQICSSELMDAICGCVKQHNFAPGDDIATCGSQATRLQFVLQGTVKIYSKPISLPKEVDQETQQGQHIGKYLRSVSGGGVIGESEFFLSQVHNLTYRASSFTQVAYIDYESLLEILNKDQANYLRFREVIDKYQYSAKMGQTCDICNWTHSYIDCPYVFHQTNIWKVVKDSNHSVYNQRMAFQRKRRGKSKSIDQPEVETCIDLMLEQGYLNENQLNEPTLSRYGIPKNQKSDSFQSSPDTHSPLPPIGGRRVSQTAEIRKSLQSSGLNKNEPVFLKQIRMVDEEDSGGKAQSAQQKRRQTKKIGQSLGINDIDGFAMFQRQVSHEMGAVRHRFSKELNVPEQEGLEIPSVIAPNQNFDVDRWRNFENYFPNFNLNKVIVHLESALTRKELRSKKLGFQHKIKNLRVIRSTVKQFSAQSLDSPKN